MKDAKSAINPYETLREHGLFVSHIEVQGQHRYASHGSQHRYVTTVNGVLVGDHGMIRRDRAENRTREQRESMYARLEAGITALEAAGWRLDDLEVSISVSMSVPITDD